VLWGYHGDHRQNEQQRSAETMADGKIRRVHRADRTSEKAKTEKALRGMEANPPHGEKGDFLKVTVTLPPKIYHLIMAEAVRRKMQKERNPQLSAVIREAVVYYLGQKGTAAGLGVLGTVTDEVIV
jgi:hypothetical protein